MNDQDRSFRAWMGDAEFVRKTLIVLGLVLLAWMLWKLSDVLLLAFGAVLVAIILHSAANGLHRYLHVPDRWSLTVATLLIFAAFIGMIALFGTQVQSQFSNVVERLPFAVDNFAKNLGFGSVSEDRKSTRLNSSHANISYAVFCLKKKKQHFLLHL